MDKRNMPKLSADMPDFIDSGGSRDLTNVSTYEKGLSISLGTALAGIFVILGLGVLTMITSRLQGVPVVGSLVDQSGTQGGAGIEVV